MVFFELIDYIITEKSADFAIYKRNKTRKRKFGENQICVVGHL